MRRFSEIMTIKNKDHDTLQVHSAKALPRKHIWIIIPSYCIFLSYTDVYKSLANYFLILRNLTSLDL